MISSNNPSLGYDGVKNLAEYLEVDKYDAGSGDLNDLRKVYNIQKKDNYFQSLQALSVRGGNVHLYKK